MTPELWQEVRPLLESALELPAAQRAAFLDAACIDPAVRREIDSLLASNEAAGARVLQTGPFIGVEAPVFRPPPGARIGVYRVIDEIAVGGMGAVFRATRDDGQYEQQVALKIMRAELGGEQAIQRFRNERQLLARLDHPNITKILDGGVSSDGVPYLVMELVEGSPITRHCDEQKLDVDGRLDLMIAICSAVQYAHQQLIVHRDLKPNNVLVTANGVPKLLDFGIAKVLADDMTTEHEPLTALGASLLTPEYASPEQFRGQPVTAASDVYSLGLILYELLCGRRAHHVRTPTPQGVAQAIEQDVVRPSNAIGGENGNEIAAQRATTLEHLQRRLRGDLDNIVMKAIRAEIEHRYASVQQLSDDLLRYQEGRPVLAHGDSASYRALKFVRRHRVGVAATALIALSLIAGTVATAYQAHRESEQRARAERHFQSVRKLANTMMFEIHDAILALPGSTQARQLIAARAQEYLESLTLDVQSDPALLAEIATAYRQLATVQGNPYNANLGDRQGALDSHRRAISLLEQALHLQPANADFQRELALNYTRTAMLVGVIDRKTERDLVQKAISILERAAVANPGDTQVSRNLASAYAQYAQHLRNGHEFALATDFYRKVLSVYEHLHEAHPDEPTFQQNLSHSHRYLGTILALQKQFPAALEQYRTAEAMNADRLARDPDNQEARFNVTLSDSNIGFVLGELGDTDGALSYYRKVLAVRSALVEADPRDERALTGLSETLNYVGVNLARRGDHLNALDAYNKSLSLRKELAKNNPADNTHQFELAWTGANIGQAHAAMARYSPATRNERVTHCKQAREWIEKSLPKWIEAQSEIKLGVGGAQELAALRQDVADCETVLGLPPT